MSNFANNSPGSNQPPQQPQQPLAEPRTRILGLEMNNAALVCYVPICAINVIASLAFLLTEPEDHRFLRFHALQSLLFCITYVVAGMIISFVTGLLVHIPFLAFIPGFLWMVISIVFIWKSCVIALYAGKGGIEKLPVIGNLADSMA